jgi:hypothetical protein
MPGWFVASENIIKIHAESQIGEQHLRAIITDGRTLIAHLSRGPKIDAVQTFV